MISSKAARKVIRHNLGSPNQALFVLDQKIGRAKTNRAADLLASVVYAVRDIAHLCNPDGNQE